MNRRRRISKFERRSILVNGLVFFVCALCILGLNTFENDLNLKVQNQYAELDLAKAKLDGLNTELVNKINFENIATIAAKKGYTLNYATSTVALAKQNLENQALAASQDQEPTTTDNQGSADVANETGE